MKVLNSSVCVGDGDVWPPGFRFHPTDEELVLYYLKRKICRLRLKLDIIAETDVYKWDPEELPGQSKLKTGDRQWFFFSPRDRKYPNGARSNRATRHGYWKATGKDRSIAYKSRSVGVKKTLIFYKGRAPSGERTDWVMHEYTMDEEELKKCQSVQDYYALYKVFKKSGPGPKNGEQYGAPFKEEDWAEDEYSNVNDHALQENSVMQVNDVSSVDNNIRANGQLQSPLRDLEELMNRSTDEPAFAQPLAVQQVFGEEETQSTMVDPSFIGQSIVTHPSTLQYDLQTSFDLTRSAISNVQLHEALEVTSVPNVCEQGPHVTEEDFLEDYLEMDDLVSPVSAVQNIQNPVENLQYSQFDGLSEFDLYQDAAMFVHDMAPVATLTVPHLCSNNIENGMVNSLSHTYLQNFQNEIVNQGPELYFNNQENEMVNPLDFQFDSRSNDASGQLWMHHQRSSIITPAASNHGVVYAGNSGNLPTSANQNESGKEEDGTVTWLSSALWSFVESIPTTPAFASENALVNRAFERMSSFGRVRIDAGNTNVAAGNSTATVRRSGKYSSKFLCFSVLGIVCAILWVMVGSVNIFGRFISS
ncbi:NAC domain-containing protein 17-like isoform X2 [Cornus florida]|uniref:NAC domain-containing protein 17-like isoform X2 n=1 Tax=Cornus florida TaxID=4283 RepID=UPI00289DF50E|nr:NAC domain-containing protein 17-like isoform X2 [Cornus florida]